MPLPPPCIVAPLPPVAALPVAPTPAWPEGGLPLMVVVQATGKNAAKVTATAADARDRRDARRGMLDIDT